METLQRIITETTDLVVASLSIGDDNWLDIEQELMSKMTARIVNNNTGLAKNQPKIPVPKNLSFAQIAEILKATMYIRVITDGDNDMELLGIYDADEGIYDTNLSIIYKAATQMNSNMGKRDLDELINRLMLTCERVELNKNPDLIAVGNGIFHYKKKAIIPFSPEYVFLSKSKVAFKDNVALVKKPDGWDVESWIKEIAVDDEVCQLLWEVIGTMLRPYVKWDKTVWLFSTEGSNGKGTFCQLLRNLLGPKACCSIPLADFAKDFALGPLIGRQAIITDENDVGQYIDKLAIMKAVVTGDVITITRKFKDPVNYRFHGMMVQCLNGYPKVKDKSDSFYRRQIFIPFEKSFKGKGDNKAIKDRYLYDADVLEYVLNKVLMSDYYQLSEPDACKAALSDYKEDNDPIRQFWLEFEDMLVWDLVPYKFLFDLYKSWYDENYPRSQSLSRNAFISSLKTIILRESIVWTCDQDNRKKVRIGSKMSKPEPLIIEYKLKDWESTAYQGRDPKKRCTLSPDDLAASYAGIVRK